MAEKEATVYIVDVGASMAERNGGREVSDLDWAMQYVWDKITTAVVTGRKTLTIGVLGLKTDSSDNDMWNKNQEESYEHLSVLQPIGQILMPDLRKLSTTIKPSNVDNGDAISSIILAVDMIVQYCRHLKYKKRITLVTNGKSPMDSDGLDAIASKLKNENIELTVLGVDFDDPEFGFKEEDKPPLKADNERLLHTLVDDCEGMYGTLAQAISELEIPRVRNVRGIPSFKGNLQLGDPGTYSSALSIQVERYYRTYVARPPAASAFVSASSTGAEGESAESSMTANDDSATPVDGQQKLTSVRSARTYQIQDEEAPGGKRDVERDELARGYEYGRTAVHISESDENITKLETEAVLEFIGFIPSDNYARYMNMSNTNVVIGQKTNNKAILALSSIIHALFELECYAVGRLVTKAGKNPMVVLLAPSIEPDFECLLEVQLPFAEDVRSYRFPPLDRVVTVSGKVVKEHRNLPTDYLLSAMSQYVDSMELTEMDEDGNQVEAMTIDDCFSPALHRISHAIRSRAVHPNDPLPPIPEVLQKLSRQPEELQAAGKDVLAELVSAADVKKAVPPKVKGRRRNRETDKPLSGLDVDELLRGQKRVRISPENAIPEFKQSLLNASDVNAIKDVAKQMSVVIEDQIRESVGDMNYDRVVEGLGTMRTELIEYEEPEPYNEFIRGLKQKLLDDQLNGDRRELWWLIRRHKVGLIDRETSEQSNVTVEEASEFISSKQTK